MFPCLEHQVSLERCGAPLYLGVLYPYFIDTQAIDTEELAPFTPSHDDFDKFHRVRAESRDRKSYLCNRERSELDTRRKLTDLGLDNRVRSDSGSSSVWTTLSRPIRNDEEVTSE